MILFLAGVAVIGPVVLYLAFAREPKGSAAIAAALSGAFAAFTAVTVATEGVMPVIVNHASNLWGVQVWYDLLISVGIALLFIIPRARQAGMNVPFWVIAVGLTASIALLAMVARLFWLERQSAAAAQAD
ncbi:hypothetical protein [Parerythrobacter lacustris]|uniref:DUF2834 domain-containing protein n=1 Tax=Parerythrobacter lacustris TaxID=2969984 RepID=A0ABT1XQ68_9SPHN|nr:hypothetical protein [Parerythrobacter lacustris]MCR2833399.1 hypothetical protein [Parerythrobacter lacustris]